MYFYYKYESKIEKIMYSSSYNKTNKKKKIRIIIKYKESER